MDEVIKKQIIAIAESGLTNMFDVNAVKEIARFWDYVELLDFLDEFRGDYVKFILYGDSNEQ